MYQPNANFKWYVLLLESARMSFLEFWLPLIIFLSVFETQAHTTPKDRDTCVFPHCSQEDFCNGYYNVVLDPKFIPKLTSFFKYCFETCAREANEQGTFRRHMLLKLLDSATPIVHKAYFDQVYEQILDELSHRYSGFSSILHCFLYRKRA